jgi:hypothetical protein
VVEKGLPDTLLDSLRPSTHPCALSPAHLPNTPTGSQTLSAAVTCVLSCWTPCSPSSLAPRQRVCSPLTPPPFVPPPYPTTPLCRTFKPSPTFLHPCPTLVLPPPFTPPSNTGSETLSAAVTCVLSCWTPYSPFLLAPRQRVCSPPCMTLWMQSVYAAG